jgi:hypothetical protein
MNLGEIREKFVQFSGRYDLINSDGSDNGANFFVSAGQKFLDRRIDFRKTQGVYFKSLSTDEWYLKLQNCRSLEKIWVNTTEERWQLEKKDLSWLYKEYPDSISETDSGDPLYWAPAELRGIRTADKDDQGDFFNYVLGESGREDFSGIVILPPTNEAITIELHGKFYSPKLVNDSDTSYWSVVVEETLLMAALYRLEIFYRNTEGAKDWLGAIDLDLADIDKDSVQEDNANVDQMEN